MDWNLPVIGHREVGPVEEARFDEVLASIEDDVVFVHAGLGDLKQAFGGDVYALLLGKLREHFGSVLAPGFTPSFRTSGIYHKQFSRPEVGAFSRQFLPDAEYRTDDPIHSILVDGPYRFPDCDHADTFSETGCWAKLADENVTYLNVGTPWLICTHHHYVEHAIEVPYLEHREYDGVRYRDEQNHERITQRNYEYAWPVKRSARKIERYLQSRGVLRKYDLEGLQVSIVGAGDLQSALEPKVRADPYYLVD